MNKSHTLVARSQNQSLKPGQIFEKLRSENPVGLKDEVYDELWQVIQELGSRKGKKYRDFCSYEQGLITLKFLAGENVFGVVPTSGGKSLTFQTVAHVTDGLTIVISPLIALMKDQVRNRDDDCLDGDWLYAAKSRDRDWLYFNSDLSQNDRREVKRRIREGRVRLLYTSPEQLKSPTFRELLASAKRRVRRIVIDEAHCVIEWGYSFRVKYLHIAQEIEAFEKRTGKRIPVLLLTATATPRLRREIAEKLRVQIPAGNFIVQRSGADRPELQIELHEAKSDKKSNEEKIRWVAKQLQEGGRFYKRPDGKRKRGIIFSTFADGGEALGALNAPTICEKLTESGARRIGCYHGKMDMDERRDIQDKFQNGKLSVLVATKAFGMGIDLPRLDFIIHFYPPLSLEEYWQEAGRGGRGMNASKGEHCDCIVLYHPKDKKLLQGFPNVASFEKILCTFTSAAHEELCFNVEKVRPGGALRKLLNHLRRLKDIRPLTPMQMNGVELGRWKLLKPAGTILQDIKEAQKSGVCRKVGQTKRLFSNLRIRADRKGTIIRVECGTKDTGHKLEYYVLELNWLTEPEIAALEMLDDEIVDGKRYSRFKILKNKLSRQDIESIFSIIRGERLCWRLAATTCTAHSVPDRHIQWFGRCAQMFYRYFLRRYYRNISRKDQLLSQGGLR